MVCSAFHTLGTIKNRLTPIIATRTIINLMATYGMPYVKVSSTAKEQGCIRVMIKSIIVRIIFVYEINLPILYFIACDSRPGTIDTPA